MNYSNPVVSSAAITTNSASTYHPLPAGQAHQISLCSECTDEDFYFTFDSTADVSSLTSNLMYCPGGYNLVINVNKPTYVNLVEGTSSGHIHIMEFV